VFKRAPARSLAVRAFRMRGARRSAQASDLARRARAAVVGRRVEIDGAENVLTEYAALFCPTRLDRGVDFCRACAARRQMQPKAAKAQALIDALARQGGDAGLFA
jgi:hypothetical protein